MQQHPKSAGEDLGRVLGFVLAFPNQKRTLNHNESGNIGNHIHHPFKPLMSS